MTFFTLHCCKNCIVCLKRPKINEKEVGVGPFFKKECVYLFDRNVLERTQRRTNGVIGAVVDIVVNFYGQDALTDVPT